MRAMIAPILVSLVLSLALPVALAQGDDTPTDAAKGASRADLEGRVGLTNSLEEHQHGVAPTYSDDELAQSQSPAPIALKSTVLRERAEPTPSRCVVPNFGATFECISYKNWLHV